MRITVVEDNVSLAKGIAYQLEDAGHAVDLLHDGADAETFLKQDQSDLVILDINLPGLDGLSLLAGMRARGDSRPVILLTARTNIEDRVIGLDAGADDYLIKPFEMAELEARVRALARRRTQPQRQFLTLGTLTFDPGGRQLTADGKPVQMPRREMAVFECLLQANGRLVSKQALLDYAYGVGTDIEDKVVEVYISRIRTRLKPFGIVIKSQRGMGYQMLEGAS